MKEIIKKDNGMKDKEVDLNIYPVKVDKKRLNEGGSKYPLSNSTHLHLICGRVKAGKSTLLNSLYMSKRFFAKDFKVKILISTTAHNDAVNKYMIEDFDFVFDTYSDGLMDEILHMIETDEDTGKYLIIFDDIIGSINFKRVGKVDKISELVSHYRHIGNEKQEGRIAIAIASQYFKYFNGILRTNASAYYILGEFPESEVKKMAEDLSYFGGGKKEFMEVFKQSRRDPHDFLYLSVEHLEARRNHTDLLWSKENGMISGGGKNEEDLEPEDGI